MRRIVWAAAVAAAAMLGVRSPSAQSRALVNPAASAEYDRLLSAISKIRILDHHGHPSYADDENVDAAPVPPSNSPWRMRPENPEWTAAARALFAYPYQDLAPEHAQWLAAKKAELRKSRGAKYFTDVIDKVGIDVAFANRIAMADYLDRSRFRWVFFVDSFMYPFDNSGLAARNPDQAAFMPMQTKMLQRYERQSGLAALPPSFAEYLSFITRALQDNQKQGGVAVKFEAAYFRPLVFDDPPRETVQAIYDRYRAGGVPSASEYKTVQDFIFRYLLTESGRLHLPVHIHSSAGAGDFFSLRGVNVLNLENVLHDSRYSRTIFVLIHGGVPFNREASYLAALKNVYLDSSATEFSMGPTELKDVLRQWLGMFPEKITFGSDAYPLDASIGAEETYWIAVHETRSALAAALAEMVAGREITEPIALRFARGFLHDNAAALYPARPRGSH